MKKKKLKMPNLAIGEGDYTAERRKIKHQETLDDFLQWWEKHGVETFAKIKKLQRARRKKSRAA